MKFNGSMDENYLEEEEEDEEEEENGCSTFLGDWSEPTTFLGGQPIPPFSETSHAISLRSQ